MHLFTFKWFRFSLIVPLLTEEKKRKEKNRMKTHRSMSRVGEKAGLLRLLPGLAFLVFGLLKQVNIAVEGKTKVAIFPPSQFQWFHSSVSQKFSNKNLYRRIRWVKKKIVWLVWNCLSKPLFVIPFFRDDSLPRARSRLSQICFLSLPTRSRSGGGPFTNLGYCSAMILAYKSFVNTSHNHFRQSLIERRKEKENFFSTISSDDTSEMIVVKWQ